MTEKPLIALAAFAAGVVLTWAATEAGHRFRLLDVPSAIKPHARPVPHTGGTAIAVVVIGTAILVGLPLLALTAALIWLIGFADDLRSLPPLAKLIVEAAAVLVWAGSLQFSLPVLALCVAAGVILLNAFNVIDGLDGLAGGCALAPLIVLATLSGSTGILASAAAGAVAGFLVFNRHPAKVFLGDEGSLLIGFLLWALLVLARIDPRTMTGVLTWTLLWLFPIANAAFVIAFRVRTGRPIMRGDRSHLYDYWHRRLGLARTLFTCWSIAVFGAVGVLAFGLR
jgi:UDP-N-acetylmuramyl pentapeptide phosphotransferase/UDP-N-acetylglucosamine-1-phosphate transferase